MNKSYKSIPQSLIGKTIAFTGTFPGVGKTYTKQELVKQLQAKGYRVFNTGTTQKASTNGGQTIASLCLDKNNGWQVKGKSRTKTYGFFIIDEAFMYSQVKLNEIKKAYPLCCFSLFGDPMQFEPADMLEPITDIDLLFSLDKMMRVKDESLMEALIQIKNGDLPEQFMFTHCDNNISDDMLLLCYNKITSKDYSSMFDDTPLKTLYRATKRMSYVDEEDETRYSVYDEVCNGDIWRLIEINDDKYTLDRISGDRKVITVSKDIFFIHFNKQNALNCHKIQGDTIRKDSSDIIIWFDKNIGYNNQTLLRFLYVALSRAEYSNQLHFCIEQVKEVVSQYKKNGPLYDYLDIAHNQKVIHTSSAELCVQDILETINSRLYAYVPNLADYPSYIDTKCATFGTGLESKKNSLDTANTVYQIKYDQRLSDRLQEELDNRTIQSLPNKGKCFVTVNDTLSGRNVKSDVTEYNWFVMEIDHIPGIPEEKESDYIYKNFVSSSSRAKYKDARNACFRIVYSGKRSYHFWFYVDNEELNRSCSRELYKAVHQYLNDTFFSGWADTAVATPEHYVRAPGVIRPETGKEQTLMSCKGKKVLHIDNIMSLLPKKEETVRVEPTHVNVSEEDALVQQAYELYKNDIPTTNGGRGKIILSKLMKEYMRGKLSKDGIHRLCEMLCRYANCPEKISHLMEYVKEWGK